jgi:hypothetical protein
MLSWRNGHYRRTFLVFTKKEDIATGIGSSGMEIIPRKQVG